MTSASTEAKTTFLVKKGLTPEEIDEAFRRAPQPPAVTSYAPAAAPPAPPGAAAAPYAAPSQPGQQVLSHLSATSTSAALPFLQALYCQYRQHVCMCSRGQSSRSHTSPPSFRFRQTVAPWSRFLVSWFQRLRFR